MVRRAVEESHFIGWNLADFIGKGDMHFRDLNSYPCSSKSFVLMFACLLCIRVNFDTASHRFNWLCLLFVSQMGIFLRLF